MSNNQNTYESAQVHIAATEKTPEFMLFYSGADDSIVAAKGLFIMAGRGLKQETTAVPACFVPVSLKKHNARKAVWFTKATVHWSNFCIC